MDRYHKQYFEKYPRRKKKPIEKPTHPSINKWFVMKRPQMNDLKQKIKEFIVWFCEDQGVTNKYIEKCDMTFISYFNTRRRTDIDNYSPKFFMDGFVEAGFIKDDDYNHIESLNLKCGYDKEWPRTEIVVEY